ncbi:MAG: YeeE/YedE thiosulfate transporter family protein [Verrucomicrobiota bacterium]
MNPLRVAVPGLILGFVVARLGFADFDELHRMLIFRDLRLLLAFALAAGLAMAAFAGLRRRLALPPVRFHRGTLPGAFLFGIGWAICGACPGVALIQLGQGKALAAVTLAGIFAGILLHDRLFRAKTATGTPPPSAGC